MRIGGVFSVYKGDNPIFLRQALDSILTDQTRLLDECVGVIEGEIGIELTKVCNFFPQVKWLKINQSNVFGLPKALNLAVDNINTDVVLKIDTDDLYSKERVESTESAFQNDQALDLHGGQAQEFSQDFTKNFGLRSVPLKKSEILRFSKSRNPFNGPSVAFKKSSFVRLGGFPQVEANEDYCLWGLFLVNNLNVSNSSEVYVFMRGGRDLVSRRSSKRYRKGELQALMYLRQIGLFNYCEFMRHVIAKQIVRRLPVKWNSYIYSKLREEKEEETSENLQSILQKKRNEN